MSIVRRIIKNADAAASYPDFNDSIYDMVFILNNSARGWILEKICREIEKESGLHCGWVFSEFNHHLPNGLPPSKSYFFAHYVMATHILSSYPQAIRAKSYVYFTHPDFTRGVKPVEMLTAFQYIDHIFCMNSEHVRFLGELGVSSDKLSAIVGGVDLTIFPAIENRGDAVGLVGGYYERKNPSLMIDIIKKNYDINFLLVEGHPDEVDNYKIQWSRSPYSYEIFGLPNLKVVQARYEEYPFWYSQMKVYLSLSHLEGGPISLLEALALDVYPIVTDTGFARDVITSEDIGWVVPKNITSDDLSVGLRRILDGDRKALRKFVEPYSWSAMSRAVNERINSRAKRDVVYALGGSGCAKDWLVRGWYSPEPEGVWMAPGLAEINVRLADIDSSKCLTLTFSTHAPRIRVPIYVRIGNSPIQTGYADHGVTSLKFKLPENCISENVKIEIECNHLFIPDNIGITTGDRRKLSVFLREMSFS